MRYGGRDLYVEWEKNKGVESYSEYVKRVSENITAKILKKYSFLLEMEYKEIKNLDTHIVRFEKKRGNCLFSIYFPNMSNLNLSVYYAPLQLKLSFNGDGEYDECIMVDNVPVSMNTKSVRIAEKELMRVFNEELGRLRLDEVD